MLPMMLACATHLGESLAFAAPPVLIIGALVAITMRERRRERREDRGKARLTF
jgi:hypothetical protein